MAGFKKRIAWSHHTFRQQHSRRSDGRANLYMFRSRHSVQVCRTIVGYLSQNGIPCTELYAHVTRQRCVRTFTTLLWTLREIWMRRLGSEADEALSWLNDYFRSSWGSHMKSYNSMTISNQNSIDWNIGVICKQSSIHNYAEDQFADLMEILTIYGGRHMLNCLKSWIIWRR